MFCDCPKCWETNCSCGWQHRFWKRKDVVELRDALTKLLDENPPAQWKAMQEKHRDPPARSSFSTETPR